MSDTRRGSQCGAQCVVLITGAASATAAAKAALESLARTAAAELAPHGVTVNCVAPG
ncbi:NAD(P)-dependent dehydrogenase (short-subunit alcohol dehydrogenase family) [Paraburkholderia bannensis]|uniref:NAD(P)-dependent dehydrogenase (Short-subunit alcohol dehydrogenase family) n=1 Tax=Paraburkholderia bannensis TaxID=765414 RepID=A0A7W9WV97_9BURK|nr:NAD(P)-dependent dehydrogenase (short-subunit alcohol dehydrogenase family) [Paraburkholderia sp. WP4_3_2]MBB6105464.1 NAD(P)-dependent dehydrogenase (short-subunit alcohol dehydrogenase family) [Paraburkholderia bannensis]